MHEFSMASGILDCAISEAAANGASKITQVEVTVGKLKQIVPEFINTVWQSITKDTMAEGSVLDIVEVEVKAKCRQCGKIYKPKADDFLCPECKLADAEILEGDDIVLSSITFEADQKTED